MRIERISETQMKFVLMNHDLEERDINISELSHSSEKTQELFREIMQLAQEEGSFSSDHTPYLIEAMRVGVDCLTVLVTKMDAADLEQRFSLIPSAKGRCRFKRNNFIEQQDYPGEDSQVVFSFEVLDMAATAASAI
ncbi:MAG: adaptor protein MecA, partial [Defluviitaleaceae bacterium]|nr:adaptor protein MecA [Defluviitaleaceae bacterium]